MKRIRVVLVVAIVVGSPAAGTWAIREGVLLGSPPGRELSGAADQEALASRASGLTPQELLGKSIVHDTMLSNPPGVGCITCHSPDTGFTGPNSEINKFGGPMPGSVAGRVGKRKPPTYAYSVFSPVGVSYSDELGAFMGGQFWDGRSPDLIDQAKQPFLDPNEMNNAYHDAADPAMVVAKVRNRPYAALFRRVYGARAFKAPADQVYAQIAEATAAYEASTEVNPFSSKYDAVRAGKAHFTASEQNGLRLFTGSESGRPGGTPTARSALCFKCHSVQADATAGPDVFSNFCYANLGVPKNLQNPFYGETDAASNPTGYNAAGASFVDYGFGAYYYTSLGLPPGNEGPGGDGRGDYLAINGTFRAPTLRNVDKRPHAGFVKAYMHNGTFKSLEQVVHFYNTRNLTTTPGEVIDFTADDPYGALTGTPLWPRPEFLSAISLQNATGAAGSADVANQVGNLGLTDREEDDVVAFLKTLSDGYFRPSRR